MKKYFLGSLLIIGLISSSYAQSKFDPYSLKPTYGPNCSAKNLEQAQMWLSASLNSDVAYKAIEKCGWKKMAKADLYDMFVHANVVTCYGNVNATKIEEYFQRVAQFATNDCNSQSLQAVKSEYYTLYNKVAPTF